MKKILSALLKLETNRYSPGVSDYNAFSELYSCENEQEIRQRLKGAKNELTAFIDYFDALKGYQIDPVVAYNTNPEDLPLEHSRRPIFPLDNI